VHAIEVDNLSKRYLLGRYEPDTLRETLSLAFRRSGPSHADGGEIWPLREVSFAVDEGESIGVIGSNGAGKTTLLKILARITEPTEGEARVRGRVGALLEVGAGFHADLTGRENVFLAGAILGMSRAEVQRRFDAIVAFSGVERFLDLPVKHYSSGMYLRLAFAVAVHVEPDVLLLDEVLAVGDVEFQRRCHQKMAETRRAGRTVLFVSHDLDAVEELCPRAIWIRGGKIAADGPSKGVIDAYLAEGIDRQTEYREPPDPRQPVSLLRASIAQEGSDGSGVLRQDAPLTLELDVQVARPAPGLNIAVYLQNFRGVRAVDEFWEPTWSNLPDGARGTYHCRLVLPPVLNAGDYRAGVWVGSTDGELYSREDLLVFRIGGERGNAERVLALGTAWEMAFEHA
jgi:ABC-2 type transport system ATP-binding protein/lipopolysaccharide transport system ATP-binding protein